MIKAVIADKGWKKGAVRSFMLVCAAVSALGTAVPARAQTGFDDPNRGAAGAAGTGDLVPVDPEVDGGDISIGATAQVVVLFRNDSGRPIEFGAYQTYPSSTVSANVTFNQCEERADNGAIVPLAPGASCAMGVSVKGLSAGRWRVELLMRHSGRSRLVTAALQGQVEAGEDTADRFISDVEAIPKELDFGNLKTAQPVIRSVVLRNITSDPIDINAIYVEAADQAGYSLRTDCASMKPGQACIVVVTWSPVLKGQATGVLVVEHTGPTTIANIELDGNFEPDGTAAAKVFPEAVPGKGLLVSSQEQVNFGSGIATTSAITVSLVNVGDAPMTLTDVGLAGSDNGLSIGNRGCAPGMVLNPVEACPLTVTWSPVREGNIFDDVHIRHDGARGVLVLPVRGGSTGIISQDSKAVRLLSDTATLGAGGVEGDIIVARDKDVDPASVLDGFLVTSHSPTRSIISGPGGSRIVYNQEEVVIGGFLWKVNIRNSGVEFRSGETKVLLLFDRSLSSVNSSSSQSGSGSGSSSAAQATPSQ